MSHMQRSRQQPVFIVYRNKIPRGNLMPNNMPLNKIQKYFNKYL